MVQRVAPGQLSPAQLMEKFDTLSRDILLAVHSYAAKVGRVEVNTPQAVQGLVGFRLDARPDILLRVLP